MSWRIWRIVIFNRRGVSYEEPVWDKWAVALARAKALAEEFKRGGDDSTWRIELINDLDEVSRSWGKLPKDVRPRPSAISEP